MKNYTITVNGNVYDVTVEETGSTASAAAPKRAAAPAAAPKAATAAPQAAGGAGSVKVEAKAGDAVKKGDTILILEIMKMETPVVAPQDGTIASVDVAVGDAVEAGAVLATMY